MPLTFKILNNVRIQDFLTDSQIGSLKIMIVVINIAHLPKIQFELCFCRYSYSRRVHY